jgi:hypothetical protein
MSRRDLLLEFIQWLVDHERMAAHIFEDPEDEDAPVAATMAVDQFLEAIGEQP